MTSSKESDRSKQKKDKTSGRKPLPKLKKLSNTGAMEDETVGGGADPASIICPTPTQPGYTLPTHLPYC